jgi:predicted phosphoribosyltransferase
VEAGTHLAQLLKEYRGNPDVIVYALPRGGVVTGFEVAMLLNAPLDVIMTRRVGHPEMPEYAISAVTENGAVLIDEVERHSVNPKWLIEETEKERAVAESRRALFLDGKRPRSAKGKIAIVVDDGIATGLTFRLALLEIKRELPAKLIAAVPFMSTEVKPEVLKIADDLVTLSLEEHHMGTVGEYYDNFPQVTDVEVMDLIRKAREW